MRRLLLLPIVIIIFIFTAAAAAGAEPKWPGVDEAVVKKVAREANRPETEPLIPLEGDAVLFAFLAAGAAGGFMAGYFYRDLFSPKRKAGKE